MSIKYEIHSIKNSQGTGEDRHFAQIFDQPAMTAEQLKSHIQASCSLTKGDVEATLSALREHMTRELIEGHRFYIPSIGYFSLAVDMDMPEGKPIDKVRADYLSVRNIRFRPDAALLKEVRKGVRFERATFTTKSANLTEDELKEKITLYFATNNCLTRRAMEQEFGLRRNAALKWLRHFTETGLLKKEGARNSPVYFLN